LNDPFDIPMLDVALAGTPFASQVRHFPEIDSTNTFAMRAGVEGAPHGSVYLADAQTGGRGRGAHRWVSSAGSGLYVSVLLRPALAPGDALWLSLAAGLAAQTAIASVTAVASDLRWPNDLLAGPRKLGGVLTEMQAEATRVRFVVIGIGINVHQQQFPAELANAATSLAIEAPGSSVTRQALLVALLRALHEEASALTGADAVAARRGLLARLETRSTWVRGKRVTVGEEEPFHGVTEGLDERGFLRVRTSAGAVRTVLSGAVRAEA
jgi:BirA family biotin operon repressor/biotin-[acetyl-CoA-carboxylase] ligase